MTTSGDNDTSQYQIKFFLAFKSTSGCHCTFHKKVWLENLLLLTGMLYDVDRCKTVLEGKRRKKNIEKEKEKKRRRRKEEKKRSSAF